MQCIPNFKGSIFEIYYIVQNKIPAYYLSEM